MIYDVSVLIPCFNAASTIQRALKSVLLFNDNSGNGTNTEVVVCDDASTDDTPVILERYSDQIRVVRHEHNQGLAPSLNSAAEVATGRYFIELDADDYLAPDVLCKLVRALDDEPQYGFVYGQTQYHGLSDYRHKPREYRLGLFNFGFDSLYAFMYRREAWDAGCRYRSTCEIEGHTITIQDWDMALQLLYYMRYTPLVLRDTLVLHYTHRRGSLTDITQLHNAEVARAFTARWPMLQIDRV